MKKTIILALAISVALAAASPAAAFAEQRIKNRDSRGAVPRKWDLPKPAPGRHADTAPVSAGGWGDGYNGIGFAYFDTGDIVVVLGTATGHAGLFDRAYYAGMYSYAVWSANTWPRNGVQREPCIKYRSYDTAYGLWVPYHQAYASAARMYCRGQNGLPYNIYSSKTDGSSWYCSKLAWAAWRYTAGVDLDHDGGYWVWPVDLLNSRRTSLFCSWN